MTRVDSAQTLLEQEGLDLLLVSPSADLQYLLNYSGHASERPTLLVVPASGPARILIPELEAPRLPSGEIGVIAYDETEDPYRRLSEALDAAQPQSVALTDQTWASVLLRLQGVWPAAHFHPATPLLRELRMRKTADEVAALERAGRADDEIFSELRSIRLEGRTEREIGAMIQAMLRDRGLADVWEIVASGPNAASPHHFSGDRVVSPGDALLLDYGGALDGYQADITRTVHIGTPGDEFVHVYEVVRQAQEAGVTAVAPGTAAEDVDAATRGVISAAGYGDFFIHRTGHGLGLEVHEEPYIVAGNRLRLEPGMVFSVEPGVYLPGKFGVRIEDIVAVTDNGAHRLNRATRELTVL